MLSPRNTDDDSEIVGVGQIEEPLWRRCESSNTIDAKLAHRRKICFDKIRIRERHPCFSRSKGSVSNSLQEKFLITLKEIAAPQGPGTFSPSDPAPDAPGLLLYLDCSQLRGPR